MRGRHWGSVVYVFKERTRAYLICAYNDDQRQFERNMLDIIQVHIQTKLISVKRELSKLIKHD